MRYVADKDGHFHPVQREAKARLHVQGDIAEFHSPDGAHISGKAQWREHLKRTGTVEMGHADIKANVEKWNKRKQAFQERLNRKVPRTDVRAVETNVLEAREYQMSRINSEVANRLDGRPAPDRKTLIKITLETARDIARRR